MINGNTLHQKWEISDEICPNSTRTMSPSFPRYCTVFGNAILHQKRELLDKIYRNSAYIKSLSFSTTLVIYIEEN